MNSPLQTDLYQLTMAAGYFHAGTHERESVFHLFFRRLPFKGGYAIAAGLAHAIEWIRDFKFQPDDIEYLSGLLGADGAPLFSEKFLTYLADFKLELDIDAIPEGTAVFPHEPILRIQGSILHAQLVETALLNIINFQTLIATKAARICHAAEGESVLEFGYRRAQGPDGGLSASRAAYLGGCDATSNVLAGKEFGIPVKGTHAHSWVMSFDDELEAFEKYAAAMPANSTLLVDTYDTLAGVEKTIVIARQLQEKGHALNGIRLDSGDLAYLSIEARKMLDEAGFPDVKIVASNDLDEHLIQSLRHQDAKIDIWGVGTNLVTAADQPALGGVYKLAALRNPDGTWQPRIKLSEQRAKSSIPGRLQVRRFTQDNRFIADAIFDRDLPFPNGDKEITDPTDVTRSKTIPAGATHFDLLQPVMKKGELLQEIPTLEQARQTRADSLKKLHPTILRLENPHTYPAGLEPTLHTRREALIKQ